MRVQWWDVKKGSEPKCNKFAEPHGVLTFFEKESLVESLANTEPYLRLLVFEAARPSDLARKSRRTRLQKRLGTYERSLEAVSGAESCECSLAKSSSYLLCRGR